MVIKRATHFQKKRSFYDLMHCWSGDALSGLKVRRMYYPRENPFDPLNPRSILVAVWRL